MKTIAIIDADFAVSPIGTRARLTESLSGEPVIRRTMRRVLAAKRLASVHLVVPAAQQSMAEDAVNDLPVYVETHSAGPPVWQRYVATSRKWALDGWRGGISGTTMFDENLPAWVAEALARREGADATAIIPAGAAIFDGLLLDRMIEHFEKVSEEVRLTFTQSAPGLTACIYHTELLAELIEAGQFIGRIMAYRPTRPQREMNIQPCFYPVENTIAHAAGRCLADTQAGMARCAAILRDCGEQVDASAASRWCATHRLETSDLPDEVEIELTTDDSLPDTTMRPRGATVPNRGMLSESLFNKLLHEMAGCDDARIVLGGFGDPMLHPDCIGFVERAHQAGIFGIALRTPGIHLSVSAIERLVSARIDLVSVLLDAHTRETYRELHHADCFEQVTGNVEALLEAARRPQNAAVPLVACEMIKTRRTMPEMEAFYDHWLNRGCGAIVSGPSHYGGRRPDVSVMDMAPPTRFACLRPFRRCVLLADGSVTLCDEDYGGEHVIGDLNGQSLRDIWTGSVMSRIRAGHTGGDWNGLSLCRSCNEWHRA